MVFTAFLQFYLRKWNFRATFIFVNEQKLVKTPTVQVYCVKKMEKWRTIEKKKLVKILNMSTLRFELIKIFIFDISKDNLFI